MIFVSFDSIVLGLNFSWSFSLTSLASSCEEGSIFVECSLGTISVWPLLKGLISRIAMLSPFSAILRDFVLPDIIEQNIQSPLRCVSWFCLMKSSISLGFIVLTCWVICSLLSFEKFESCFRSRSFICWDCSPVKVILELNISGL